MEYKETPGGSRLDVTITQLTKSDSGRYRCGLDIRAAIDPYWEFKIIVTDGEFLLKVMKMFHVSGGQRKFFTFF